MSDKIFSIPGTAKRKITASQQSAVEILDRREAEQADTSATELVIDGSNKVSFPGFPYLFEALGERILVSIDIFKSGYECKVCKGKRRTKYQCGCVSTDRPGMKYSTTQLADITAALGPLVAESRELTMCQECGGNPQDVARDETCPECNGKGALLILSEGAKNLPTTGVVLSMGAEAKAKAGFTIGDRILFSPHAGQMIPTKVGLMFKYMDWYAAAIKIEGAEAMAAFDFILNTD